MEKTYEDQINNTSKFLGDEMKNCAYFFIAIPQNGKDGVSCLTNLDKDNIVDVLEETLRNIKGNHYIKPADIG